MLRSIQPIPTVRRSRPTEIDAAEKELTFRHLVDSRRKLSESDAKILNRENWGDIKGRTEAWQLCE